MIAASAIPSAIRLVAQMRQRLLDAVRPFAPERVAAEEEQAAHVRLATSDLSAEERLTQRVAHLRAIVAWLEELVATWDAAAVDTAAPRQAVLPLLDLAHKVLADRADPAAGMSSMNCSTAKVSSSSASSSAVRGRLRLASSGQRRRSCAAGEGRNASRPAS